jgi:hypothetical protein
MKRNLMVIEAIATALAGCNAQMVVLPLADEQVACVQKALVKAGYTVQAEYIQAQATLVSSAEVIKMREWIAKQKSIPVVKAC